MTRTFNPSAPFVLMSDGNGSLTKESAAKALNTTFVKGVTCHGNNYDYDEVSCSDISGGSLLFNTRTSKGGVSQLFGSIKEEGPRDTISLDAFECTKG